MTAKKGKLPKAAPAQLDEFVLPHNLEAERAALGAALINPTSADYLVDRLTPPAFFRRAHQAIFEAVRDLRARRVEVDMLTVRDWLRKHDKLEEVGGAVYLSTLTDAMPRSTNVAHYAGIIRDLHGRRALVQFARHTIDLVAEATHQADVILADADRRLMELQAGHLEGRMASVASQLPELWRDIEYRCEHRGELSGLDTGYASINELTLGWQAGDLVVIGARPSIGKTTFVLNTATHGARTARRDGSPTRVAIFSLEMRRQQLEYRLLSSISGVPLSRILGGYITEGDHPRLAQAYSDLGTLQIEIDDRAGQSFPDIRAACRRLKAESAGLDLIVVDYVQLVPGSLDRRGATRNDEVTDISRRLKQLADEVTAPVLLLSQLSREGEKRADPRPRLSDLRESGALEQDADVVAFLHRKHHRESGVTNFIIEKQRNGPAGTVNLTVDRDTVTFTDGGVEPAAPEFPLEKERRRRSRPYAGR